jgi:hypothetical protein
LVAGDQRPAGATLVAGGTLCGAGPAGSPGKARTGTSDATVRTATIAVRGERIIEFALRGD